MSQGSTPTSMPGSRHVSRTPNQEGYRISEVPRFVQFTSPVIESPNTPSPTTNLPLNLLALIISFLDDIGDIARVTRTSRLLYFMTLPQLYKQVSLRSYSEIRYVNGKPEGYGGGSPFTMAINGLATKSHVALVHDLKVLGELGTGAEEFAKGRLPDNSVMLNSLLRIIVDKATRLRRFSWELDAKPMLTFYQGLSTRQTLTSLTIRCQTTRVPRPTIIIPAMPNLKAFRYLDIDPLCHPDDISLLILESKKLVDLRLHFSPRMRQQAECTISLDAFFGRSWQTGYLPKVKHFAMQNFFGTHNSDMFRMYDPSTLRSIAFLDTFGGARSAGANLFIDDTWRHLPRDFANTFHTIRFNEPATQHIQMLEGSTIPVERFYFVNDLLRPPSAVTTPATLATPDTSPSEANQEVIGLGKEYLHVLTRKHGSSLKHLLLCDQWALTQQEIGDVVRLCPNLTQLACSLDGQAFDVFRIVIQFLRKLVAVRIFENDHFRQQREMKTVEQRLIFIGRDFYRLGTHNIQYVGAGCETYRVGGVKQIINEEGNLEEIQDLIPLTFDEVKHVEIWGMDKLDIMIEPDLEDSG